MAVLLLFFLIPHMYKHLKYAIILCPVCIYENNLISFQNKLLYHLGGQKTKTKPGNKEFDPVHSSFRLFPIRRGKSAGT